MNTRALVISTLSPIHIGCDEVYEPSNFVIDGGLLYAFDPADLADSLTDSERKQLGALADQREPIGAIQRFFRDHAERFAALARHEVSVADAIVSEYKKSAGKPTQRGAAGEATYKVFPIARTAYRPIDNVPYLPGSSLKGSIRTAWLNQLNRGAALSNDELRDKKNGPKRMQERLLGYAAGKFENDPFRHIRLADAHPEVDGATPPARILYAISKKKRQPRDGESGSPELKVFLETVPETIPAAFLSELRLSDKIEWNALCDACNGFYLPQLVSEMNHAVLGAMLDADWKSLIVGLLGNELDELIKNRQGFLLRVGRHSGAESVTLDGVRDIKILGPRVDGRQTSDYRPNTTEKRFASLTKAAIDGLLPFGWIWVDACEDAYRHHSDALLRKLAVRSSALREDHQDRLLRRENRQAQRDLAATETVRQKQAAEAAVRAEDESRAAHQAALAGMSPNLRGIELFKAECAVRAEQLKGKKDNPNTAYHQKARELAKAANDGADWTLEEKCAAADAIEEWLPKIVTVESKTEFKKLKLNALRAS